MKKFIVVLFLILVSYSSFAQDNFSFLQEDKKNELSIGYGPINGMTFLEGFVNIFVAIGESIGKTHRDNVSYPGLFTLEYHYQINKSLNLGAKAIYRTRSYDRYRDTDNSFVGHYANHAYTILPSLQYTYINEEYLKLYSGLDAGVCLYETYNSSSDTPRLMQVFPSFNLTVIGLKYGKDVYGLAEVNLGSDALVKAGLGMRF